MSFEAGTTIGEYTVESVLGQGGLGTVYRVKHNISQRLEAMKVLHPERTETPELAERFRREIQMLASLNHPNIARLHTAFYFNDQLVMMMELVEGEDLRSLSRRTSIGIPQLLDYFLQALRALEYAHARGVVHRDIKPANTMVSPGGLMKLLDFGLAYNDTSSDLTMAGAVVGSPLYMSPEQVRGEKATTQSDLYSFGVTLYELIARSPPIQGKNSYELMMGHLHTQPRPLRELRPDIPRYISDALARAMEKDPARRFATATDLLNALTPGDHPTVGLSNELTATMAPVSGPHRAGSDPSNRTPSTAVPQPLEPLVKHLAAFIGPIAKITIIRLSKKHQTSISFTRKLPKRSKTPPSGRNSFAPDPARSPLFLIPEGNLLACHSAWEICISTCICWVPHVSFSRRGMKRNLSLAPTHGEPSTTPPAVPSPSSDWYASG